MNHVPSLHCRHQKEVDWAPVRLGLVCRLCGAYLTKKQAINRFGWFGNAWEQDNGASYAEYMHMGGR